MLVDEIKKRITAAMKQGDAVARDVLRLVLSEIQAAEARKNAGLAEEDAVAEIRKLIKSNEETLGRMGEDERAAALRQEISILKSLIPAQLTPEQIVSALGPQHEALKAAKNDGQATGIAMKHLKQRGADVDGKDVAIAVKQIRG